MRDFCFCHHTLAVHTEQGCQGMNAQRLTVNGGHEWGYRPAQCQCRGYRSLEAWEVEARRLRALGCKLPGVEESERVRTEFLSAYY